MSMKQKYFYAEYNHYGLNIINRSEVLRFKTKKERDEFVKNNMFDDCKKVCDKLSYKEVRKMIGYKKYAREIWDSENNYEIFSGWA